MVMAVLSIPHLCVRSWEEGCHISRNVTPKGAETRRAQTRSGVHLMRVRGALIGRGNIKMESVCFVCVAVATGRVTGLSLLCLAASSCQFS